MATQTEVLAQSQLENAQVLLIYDDVTLIGTGIQVSVGAEATRPCTVTVTFADGTVMSQTVQPNKFNQIFPIPQNKRPQGVIITSRFGTQGINWGFQVGISF